jgi:hypothetical protein
MRSRYPELISGQLTNIPTNKGLNEAHGNFETPADASERWRTSMDDALSQKNIF